ncbi:transcriptional regulator of sporulation / germination [Paenibacillus alvei]|uniref:Transcriptional regulator of sporulation / germination n=4 Tax=Paenibacillus TaxID=44249 RepID=A0A383RJJ4_PAEAL|nr:transcriptional regulator of sporulation / germination [Paenibacillus alvei]
MVSITNHSASLLINNNTVDRKYLLKAGQLIMKATGIVRRIDDLGRVVIPKEIRRTLRIREGDPLEIFVDRDGEVILKKYSPIGELGDFAKEYAESLYESTGHITMISDRDTVIAVAGGSKKEYMDKQIGMLLENCMENRKTMIETNAGNYEIVKDSQEAFSSFVVAPIVAGGDPIGTVVMLNKDDSVKMSQMEVKMSETAAGFLGKQMEQ